MPDISPAASAAGIVFFMLSSASGFTPEFIASWFIPDIPGYAAEPPPPCIFMLPWSMPAMPLPESCIAPAPMSSCDIPGIGIVGAAAGAGDGVP